MLQSFQKNPYSINLDNIVKALIQAADKLVSMQNTNFEVYKKTDNTSVTSADLESDKIIKKELKLYCDMYDIISEEDKFINTSKSKNYFLIDPLDGTNSFINHKTDFTINLAIIIEDLTKFGIIVEPFQKKMWIGGVDFDVVSLNYKNTDNYKLTKIKFQPLYGKNIRIVESVNSKKTKSYYQNLLKEGYSVAKILKLQAATKFIAILNNTADLYYRSPGIMPWDLAAGDALIKAYGGISREISQQSNFKEIIYSKQPIQTSPFYIARETVLKKSF